MSDYPKVQTSIQPLGKNYTIRADSAEELLELIEGLLKHSDEITEGLTQVEQVILAKGVMTGPASESVDAPSQTVNNNRSSGPPGSSSGGPSCKHGPMKDLSSKNYKYRWYCTNNDPNWKNNCKPEN